MDFVLSGREELPAHPGALHLTATSRYESEDSACFLCPRAMGMKMVAYHLVLLSLKRIFPRIGRVSILFQGNSDASWGIS